MQGRIIKFRAYDELTKIWSYFDLDSIEQDESYRTYLNGMKKSDKTIIEQYTGLKDKNGKEIYEGDILKVGQYDYLEEEWMNETTMHKVEWQGSEGYPAFELNPHPYHEMNGLAYIFQAGDDSCEIIGNIHENPELLNG